MQKFLKSFYYAFEGIKTAYSQRNFKIHVFVAVIVVIFGEIVGLSSMEWIVISIMIATVISAEIFNSAIEEICNIITKKLELGYADTRNPRDLAAGAVLVTAICAFVIGLIIFIPKVLRLFG
jgi:undecaprenol kinase